MSSRFWAAQSDDDSASDDDSSSGGEQKQGAFAGYGYDSSSSEEETKRVVRSKKDKASAATNAILTKLKNFVKIDDWKSAQQEFSELQKHCLKTKTESDMNVLIRTICKLEEDIDGEMGAWANKKKLHKDNQRALTRVRQDIRKMISGEYQEEVAAYKENPEQEEESDFAASSSDDDSSDDSDSDSDSDSDEDSDDDKGKQVAGDSSGSDSDDSVDWDSDSSSESSDEETSGYVPSRDRWLKKTVEVTTKKERKVRDNRPKEKEGAEAEDEVPKKEIEWTTDMINKKLKEIVSNRGRRGTDRQASVGLLEELITKVKTAPKKIEIMVHLISCLFDSNPNMLSHLATPVWKKTAQHITELLELLEENPEVTLFEGENLETVEVENLGENEDGEISPVTANLLGFLERLDDELNKSYQALDPSLNEYLVRLQDEVDILKVAEGVQAYYLKKENWSSVAASARRRIEHLYWRTTAMVRLGGEAFDKFVQEFDDLCVLVYRHGDDRTNTRVMLCHISHYAQRGEFYRARDMLLMSHLQDNIQMSDIGTQILFNRTMVQLGLSAFTRGLISDAHSCLAEVLAGSRHKELLAQGLSSSRFAERNQEQEREERRRQMPYHMHINLELLEFCHLTCAMLLEVPNMAEQSNSTDLTRRRVISKPFRRTLEHLERQAFAGPPENTRDMVMHASKALMRGDWQKCANIILERKCWSILPDHETVKETIKRKIQEEGLRTYLFTYAQNYDSLSLEQLSEMFSLESRAVHSLVSKMMINEELMACWDQPTNAIVMHQSEPTRLQTLALQFAEKAAVFVENNEKLLDVRTGGYGFKYDKKDGKDSRWENRDWDNNRQNYNSNRQSGYNKPYNKGYNNRQGGARDRSNDRRW